MVDESSRSVPASCKLGPGSLDRIIHQHVPAGVELPPVPASEHHHLRSQHRSCCVTGNLQGVAAQHSVRSRKYL